MEKCTLANFNEDSITTIHSKLYAKIRDLQVGTQLLQGKIQLLFDFCKGTLYQNSKGGNGAGSYEESGAWVWSGIKKEEAGSLR